jgi:multicomponent Na+:H+ antiporter subunit E
MSLLFLNIFLALTWASLTGSFALQNLVVGFLLGFLTLYLVRGALGKTSYFNQGWRLFRFTFYFAWELFVANLRVARDVLRPGPLKMRPRVIAVPLDRCGDIEVTLLANVLSLTPGTLSLDVSGEDCLLFVHAIHAPDGEETTRQIKDGFERLVFDLFRHDGDDLPLGQNPDPILPAGPSNSDSGSNPV